jgi:hypothetical protein
VQWYIDWSRPNAWAADNRKYYDYALFGNAEENPGADWLGGVWHARNFRIFANLVRLDDRPGDRRLVIYGMGHAHLLQQFATESGAFKVVSPLPYLKKAAH